MGIKVNMNKKSANLLTKILMAPIKINQSERNLQQTLLYKFSTHPTNLETQTVSLIEKIGF